MRHKQLFFVAQKKMYCKTAHLTRSILLYHTTPQIDPGGGLRS